MAVRGILMPFPKTTPSTFNSLLGKVCGPRRRARFICRHAALPSEEIDMSMSISEYKRDKFAQKMGMSGLKPHHPIAIAVSGGPDSMALCVLTADWKSEAAAAVNTKGRTNHVDGLLAIVVDHGLRPESAEEANLVQNRVLDMGIKCEVAHCEWLDGRPKPGHVQEAARNMRYETLQNICIQHHISVLLVAHHADDQAELFILRLSRNSGVLGLAGMSFTSQIFSEFPDFSAEGSRAHGILVVRPLLEFSKEDMYDICRGGKQQWVEDPTNRSPVYARNRIRMSLSNLSSSTFKAELQATIAACRRTRLLVDKCCNLLLNQTVTIMPHGYAVIDLETLNSMEVKNIILAKFATSVVQFISQRHRPVRGNAVKLLLSYVRTFPSKTCLTVAGCYLCPAPGSKGTKALVCCSVDLSSPVMMKMFHPHSYGGRDLEQIVAESETYLDRFMPDASSVPFLDVASSEPVLVEAKRLGILSHSVYESIVSLQKEESENFKPKAEAVSNFVSKDDIRCSNDAALSKFIMPGQVGFFMDRFVVDWRICDGVSNSKSNNEKKLVVSEGDCFCSSCITGDEMGAEVRHMVDGDWLYLLDLSKKANLGPPENQPMDYYGILSASRALVCLKSIPVAARRAIPVLINAEGVVLSIPSIGFSQCRHLKTVSVVYSPRIPLGGGHSSFL